MFLMLAISHIGVWDKSHTCRVIGHGARRFGQYSNFHRMIIFCLPALRLKNMSNPATEKKSLDEFKMWKVPQLREYLRNRRLKTTGTKAKEELTALAFGAKQLSVPLKLTYKVEIKQKKEQYRSLLIVNGKQLPDQFTDLEDVRSVKRRE